MGTVSLTKTTGTGTAYAATLTPQYDVVLVKASGLGSLDTVTVNIEGPGGPATFADVPFTIANPASLRCSAFAPIGFAVPWTLGADTTNIPRTVTVAGASYPCWLGPTYGKDDNWRWCQVLGLDVPANTWIQATLVDELPGDAPAPKTTQAGLAAFSFPEVVRGAERVIPINYVATEPGAGRTTWRGHARFSDGLLVVIYLYTYAARNLAEPVLSQVGFEVQVICSDRGRDHYYVSFGANDLQLEIDERWDIHVDWLTQRGGSPLPSSNGYRRVKLFDSEDVTYLAQGQSAAFTGAFYDTLSPEPDELIAFQARSEHPVLAIADPDAVVALLGPWGIRPTLHPDTAGADAGKTAALADWDWFVQTMAATAGTIFTTRRGTNTVPLLAHNHDPSGAGEQPDFGVGMISAVAGPDWGNPYALRMFMPALLFALGRPFNHRDDTSSYTGDTSAIISPRPITSDSQVIDYDVFTDKLFLWGSRPHSQGDSLLVRTTGTVTSIVTGNITAVFLSAETGFQNASSAKIALSGIAESRPVESVASVTTGSTTTITLSAAHNQTGTAWLDVLSATKSVSTDPNITGERLATIIDATSFSIPVDTSSATGTYTSVTITWDLTLNGTYTGQIEPFHIVLSKDTSKAKGTYSGGTFEFPYQPRAAAGEVEGYKNSHFPASRFSIVALLTGSGMLLEACTALEANYRYMCQNATSQKSWNSAFYVSARSYRSEFAALWLWYATDSDALFEHVIARTKKTAAMLQKFSETIDYWEGQSIRYCPSGVGSGTIIPGQHISWWMTYAWGIVCLAAVLELRAKGRTVESNGIIDDLFFPVLKSWAQWGFFNGRYPIYDNQAQTHTCSSETIWWDAALVLVEPPSSTVNWPWKRPKFRNATNDSYSQATICGPLVTPDMYKWIFHGNGAFTHWQVGGIRGAIAVLQDYIDRGGTYAAEATAANVTFKAVLAKWHNEWQNGSISKSPYLFHKHQDTSFPTNYLPSGSSQTVSITKVSGLGAAKVLTVGVSGSVTVLLNKAPPAGAQTNTTANTVNIHRAGDQTMYLERVPLQGSTPSPGDPKTVTVAASGSATMTLVKTSAIGAGKTVTIGGHTIPDKWLELTGLWVVMEELDGMWL